ncbi:MAG: MerR family transcriptional regulator [Alphaproteobacteria bacterium]|jgi:DNA-binding transcriptional MerR regulator
MKSPNALKTIGETSKLISVPIYILRFWEKKFSVVKPIKKNGGYRYYDSELIIKLKLIKELLYEKKYSIDGVKRILTREIKLKNEKNNIIEEISVLLKKLKKYV